MAQAGVSEEPHSRFYKCEDCGRTYEEAWSKEEAEAEALATQGIENAATAPGMVRLCDHCYEELMEVWARMKPN